MKYVRFYICTSIFSLKYFPIHSSKVRVGRPSKFNITKINKEGKSFDENKSNYPRHQHKLNSNNDDTDMKKIEEFIWEGLEEDWNRLLSPKNRTHTERPGMYRIIGGSIVSKPEERYPYMASILNSRRIDYGRLRVWHVCGGSLIAPDIVLGAAHCAGDVADYVQLGRSQSGTNIDEIETFRIVDQIYHPDWDRRLFYQDMVLFKIDRESRRNPIKLSTDNRDNILKQFGKISKILGWGKTSLYGDPSPYLREAEVSYIPHEECTGNKYSYGEVIKENAMMCFAADGKDACQGDSGGPLIQVDKSHKNDPKYDVQIGVISWGVDCAHKRYPGVYAKLDFDWIERTICDRFRGLSRSNCQNGEKLYSDKDLMLEIDEGETHFVDQRVCEDLKDDEWFHRDWDMFAWNCPKVKRWWWYACRHYNKECPISCCGHVSNCDSNTGSCLDPTFYI